MTQIVEDSQPAPDGNGVLRTSGVFPTGANASGQIAIEVELADASGVAIPVEGVFLGDGGPLTQIARTDQPTPDGDGQFDFFISGDTINDAGQALVFARLLGTVDPTVLSGLYRGSGQALTEIARDGRSLPEGAGAFKTSSGARNFSDVSINNLGQVAFDARFEAADLTVHTGIFISDGIDIVEVARSGQPLAGSTINGLDLSGGVNQESGFNE